MKFIFVCIVTVAIAGKDTLCLLSSQRLSSIQNEIADDVMNRMGYEVHTKNEEWYEVKTYYLYVLVVVKSVVFPL